MKPAQTKIEESVEVPEGVTASVSGSLLAIKGPKGEVSRDFYSDRAVISFGSGRITIKAERRTKREKQIVGTFKAHISNMVKGVVEGHCYTLKVCSGHFPINVSVSGKDFSIKNFMGEKTARKIAIPAGVSVKVSGSDIEVEGTDKDIVGNFAAAIEKLTRRQDFDRRVFQDGIILTSKARD